MTNDEIKREFLESYGVTEEEFEAIDVLLDGGARRHANPYFRTTVIPERLAEAAEVLEAATRDELRGEG